MLTDGQANGQVDPGTDTWRRKHNTPPLSCGGVLNIKRGNKYPFKRDKLSKLFGLSSGKESTLKGKN